ncbi:hypothetical protein HZB60_06440 [candidate division KSB1 bacterium]|nr:hypothetical protein [candidate division KSB1 bacterium]
MKFKLCLFVLILVAIVSMGYAVVQRTTPLTPSSVTVGVQGPETALSTADVSAPEYLKVPATSTVLQPRSQVGPTRDSGAMNELAGTFDRSAHRSFIAESGIPYVQGNRISFGETSRRTLDMPLCSLEVAPDTGNVSLFSGILPGDAYKVWIDPADCPNCAPNVYPFGIDSVCFIIVQEMDSPPDTVVIGVDIECSNLQPATPCNGPGAERCFAVYSIPLDTNATGGSRFLSVCLPLDTCRVDGPFFVGLWHLGHTLPDSVAFHPNVVFQDTLPQPVPCEAWTNLLGGWDSWENTWVGDPGIPIVEVFGECSDLGAGAIATCPVECADTLIGSPLAYYVTGVTAFWQYFDLDPADFPYHPTAIHFDLYYDTTGTTADTTEYLITYGCPSNGNICCVPSDILCAGTAQIIRSGTGDNLLVPISLNLDPLTCCLESDFFVGVIMTRHVGTTGGVSNYPKFLTSNRVTEQGIGNDIPSCYQWSFGTGGYTPYPSGSQLGWYSLDITATCGACPTAATACSPNFLDCTNATVLACNPNPQTLTNQSTIGGAMNANLYCCQDWWESGPEKVYSITIPANGSVNASVSNTGGQDLDIFLLSACDPGNTVACGDSVLNVAGLNAGTYYLVVDGFDGAEGGFTLTYTIPCATGLGCPTTLCGTGLNGNGTLLAWDGELLPNGNVAYLCQGTAVGGNDMVVKILDPACALVSTVDLGAGDLTRASRGVAYDNRDSSWWVCTFRFSSTSPGHLWHYNAAGTLIATFDSSFFAGQTGVYSFSGCTFDADNNHLWLICSSAARYVEMDVNNMAAPTIIQQGSMPIHAGAGYSAAGLDYDECNDRMFVSTFRGSPLTRGEVECWQDVNPGGVGGVTLLSYCSVSAGGITLNWGLARSATTNVINLPNLDATANTDHRVWTTTAPCAAVPPQAPTAVRCLRSGADIRVFWNAPTAGRYSIWKTTVKNNVFPADFTLESTVTVPAGIDQIYVDVGAFAPDAYLNYVIIQVCP